MPGLTDVTAVLALAVAVVAAWYSRRSAIAAGDSAATARRAHEQSQNVRLVLTDKTGGHSEIELMDGCLKVWVTNGGEAVVRIRRIDLVAKLEVRDWWLRLYGRHMRQSYASHERIGYAEPPELHGGGAQRGANVAELRLNLDEADRPLTWGWMAPDAPDPARTLLAAERSNATLAIEIVTETLGSGVREWHTVPIRVVSDGRFRGAVSFADALEKGSIIDKRPGARG